MIGDAATEPLLRAADVPCLVLESLAAARSAPGRGPPDGSGTVGGSAAEETETPLERSDGSDREPLQATGCLTSGARSKR